MSLLYVNRDNFDQYAEQIVTLDKKSIEQFWSKGQWGESIDSPFSLIISVFEGKLCGFALFQVSDVSHLLKIAVSPQFKRQGLGSKILNYHLNNYPQKGIFLEVSASNQVAISFYEKLKFKTLHIEQNYYSNGDSCCKMMLSV